jgi:Protein of unknown function (DUF2380)
VSHGLRRRTSAVRRAVVERQRQVQSPRHRQPGELDVAIDAELGLDLVVQVVDGLDAQMQPLRDVVPIPGRRIRTWTAIAMLGVLQHGVAYFPALAADAEYIPAVKIAVFDFELEDVSPAASLPGASATAAATMEKVSSEARRMLAQSGRYSLVDVSKVEAKPVTEKSLRNCDGCEIAIALQLGAEQALVGVVRRVSMTDYYVMIQISDCRTGKVLDQQVANFAGGEDGWASAARMLIKHGVLASDN